jgi:hypothetical protein
MDRRADKAEMAIVLVERASDCSAPGNCRLRGFRYVGSNYACIDILANADVTLSVPRALASEPAGARELIYVYIQPLLAMESQVRRREKYMRNINDKYSYVRDHIYDVCRMRNMYDVSDIFICPFWACSNRPAMRTALATVRGSTDALALARPPRINQSYIFAHGKCYFRINISPPVKQHACI